MSKIKIYTSPQFKKVLAKMASESWIANELFRGNINSDLLVENPINYIRISGSDDTKISYLPMKKIDQALKIISKKYNRTDLSTANVPPEMLFKAHGRVKIKYGSFVNKLFKDVNPKDIEKFASLLKSIINQPPFTMKVVEGDDIRKYYHYSYHHRDSGSLGSSCMKHDKCQRWFDMYRHNSNIKMVMMINNQDDRVMARALLWNLGKENGLDEDFKFMDRIYYTKDDQTHHFFEWANKNGYAYKEKQSWNIPYRFQYGSEKFEKKMKINLKVNPSKFAKTINGEPNGGGGLPYLDTFKWMNMIDGTLYNYKPYDEENRRDIYTMVATNGGYYGFNYIKEDEYHKEFWYESEVKYVPYLDKLISDRYLNWSNVNDTYILKDHSIREGYINDIIFNEEYDKFNDRVTINRIIEEKREKERKLMEKIKKDTISSLSFFEKYVKASEPFLLGKRKTIPRVNYDIGESSPITSSEKEIYEALKHAKLILTRAGML